MASFLSSPNAGQMSFMELQKPILEELAQIGLHVPSVGDLWYFRDYVPLPTNVVDILLRWLLKVTDERLQESLVRLLGTAKDRFDGAALARLFESTPNMTLRWSIANTIAETRPRGLCDWVAQTARNSDFGEARQMLMFAVARLIEPTPAKQILRELFESFPMHVAGALAEIGDEADVKFLDEHARKFSGPVKKDIDRSIKCLKKRVERVRAKQFQASGMASRDDRVSPRKELNLPTREPKMHDLVECSANFDLTDVGPFLSRIARLVQRGFDKPEIREVVDVVGRLNSQEEREFVFSVEQQGLPSELRLRVFMGDVDSPDIYFFATPSLANQIQLEMERYCDEEERRG